MSNSINGVIISKYYNLQYIYGQMQFLGKNLALNKTVQQTVENTQWEFKNNK